MKKIIITSVNGGFTAQYDNGTNIKDYGLIDCRRVPQIIQSDLCPVSGQPRYIIVDEEENKITFPVLASEFEVDGVLVPEADVLNFLNVLCPIGGAGGTTEISGSVEVSNLNEICECACDDLILDLNEIKSNGIGGFQKIEFPYTLLTLGVFPTQTTQDATITINGNTYIIKSSEYTWDGLTNLVDDINITLATNGETERVLTNGEIIVLQKDSLITSLNLGLSASINSYNYNYNVATYSESCSTKQLNELRKSNSLLKTIVDNRLVLMNSLLMSIDTTITDLDGNHTDLINKLNEIKTEIISNGTINANQLIQLQSVVSELTALNVDVSALLTTTNNIYNSDLLRNDFLSCIEDGLINNISTYPDYDSPTTETGTAGFLTTFPITNTIANPIRIAGSFLVDGLAKGYGYTTVSNAGTDIQNLEELAVELKRAIELDVDTQNLNIRVDVSTGAIRFITPNNTIVGFTLAFRTLDGANVTTYTKISDKKISAIDTTNESLKELLTKKAEENQIHIITSNDDLYNLAGSSDVISYSAKAYGDGAKINSGQGLFDFYSDTPKSESATGNNILTNNVFFEVPTSADFKGRQSIEIILKTK